MHKHPEYAIPVRNAEEARKAVQPLKAMGADFVKVYDGVQRDAYFAISAVAFDVSHIIAWQWIAWCCHRFNEPTAKRHRRSLQDQFPKNLVLLPGIQFRRGFLHGPSHAPR